jgi:NAD(P)-dependent dehydrogenase (short-subunit alcohol dehydrogenase family)
VRRTGEGRRVVLTSSVSARRCFRHHALHAPGKASVEAMVLNLAPELGERGITINAIATATDKSACIGPRHFARQTAAWKAIPSWYFISTADQVITPPPNWPWPSAHTRTSPSSTAAPTSP